MQTRAIRILICVLLLIAAGVAWQRLSDIDRRAAALGREHADVGARLDRIAETLHGIRDAQQNYVIAGENAGPWFERTAALLQQYYDETSAIGVLLRSPESGSALESMEASARTLTAVDTRARENLRVGQAVMAADLITSDGRDALDSMLAAVRQLQAAEMAVQEGDTAAHAAERMQTLAAVSLAWTLGLFLLALIPVRTKAEPAAAEAPASIVETPAPAVAEAPIQREAPPAVDLPAAAELCTSLSRLTASEQLPPLLARAASLLDASGIVLWMGAGEELFAVTAHGYPPAMLARLGSIPRNAQNATATAWRDGRLTVVASDADAPGAIVAPLFGPENCVGVLSVEIRGGRESDKALQAVASMIAAQLATAVSAWPAASEPVAGEAADGGAKRQLA